MKKAMIRILALLMTGLALFSPWMTAGAKAEAASSEAIPIRVLIIPKFEIGEMNGDYPGEAQYYYERYLDGGEKYEIMGGPEILSLYVKDGITLFLTGIGKINAALCTVAVLSDERFDFSNAYILSTGCAGSAKGSTVMGDMFVISTTVDYDLGHHADIRDMENQTGETWFRDESFDATAVHRLDPELTDKVWNLVKDLPMETTEKTRNYMSRTFDGAEWAVRDPKVMRGTTVTADNYWKGEYDHANALKMIRVYGCPDPFVTTEMEDNAVCAAARWMGLLDRVIVLRVSVNMDVFMNGATPERLWDAEYDSSTDLYENNLEAADIFETSMKNNFTVGSTIIDAILAGDF